jgi:hypothetical protein
MGDEKELTDREAYLLLKERNARARDLIGRLTSENAELKRELGR